MTFQNSRYTGKSKIWRISWLLIVCSATTLIAMGESVAGEFGYKGDVSLLFKLPAIAAIWIVYGVFTYVRHKKKYCFIFFTDEDKQNLVFRFYHIKIFGKKYSTYKIPIPDFYKYQIVKENNKHELYLYQRIQNKFAKYPPISITALTKSEISTLMQELNTYTKA